MDSLLCDKPCAKCFTYLVSFNSPPTASFYKAGNSSLATLSTKVTQLRSGVEAKFKPGRTHTHFSPLQEAAGWGIMEVREDLAALDINV